MNTIEETIKNAGFGKRKIMRKQIEMFEKELGPGEELLGAAASFPKPSQQLYVTNKRVFSHKIINTFTNEKKEIPVSSISSVNSIQNGLSFGIEVVASNNKLFANDLLPNVAQEIKRIIDDLIYQN